MTGLLRSLLMACVLVQVAYGVYPVAASNPQSLASLFFRSRLASQDPAVSMACFSDYIEKSSEVSETYGKDYNQCLVEAKLGRTAIEAEMEDERINIAENSQNVCQRLSTCDGMNTTLDIFNCHAKIGANNTKAVYGISGNASEFANIMQEKYRIIDLRHDQCCKSSERTYVEATAVNYRTLQDCLEGRIQPTTTSSTTTTTTSTTTTTTEAPTTTAAPSTTTPESTTTSTTSAPPTPPVISTTTTGLPEVEQPTLPALAAETEQFAKLLKLLK